MATLAAATAADDGSSSDESSSSKDNSGSIDEEEEEDGVGARWEGRQEAQAVKRSSPSVANASSQALSSSVCAASQSNGEGGHGTSGVSRASAPVGGIVATVQAFLVEKWGSEEGQEAKNEAAYAVAVMVLLRV